MTGLATAFAPSIYAGPGAQSGTAYPLAIDSALAALGHVGATWQPTVTNADMIVHVAAGTAPTAAGVTSVAAQAVALAAADPAHDRIDLVVLDRVTGTASAVAGTPAATPVAPDVPAGKLPCCRMTVRAGAAAIVDVDGADTRAPWLLGTGRAAFEQLGGVVVDDGAGNLTLDHTQPPAATSVDLANDLVLVRSAADGVLRKVAPNLLGGVTAAQVATVEQDLMSLTIAWAAASGAAAGQMPNYGFDAFNADTLSGVSGTSGQTYDSVAKVYSNPAGYALSAPTGTPFGDLTSGGGLPAAFDGTTNKTNTNCAYTATSSHGFVGKPLAGPQAITKLVVTSSSNYGFSFYPGNTVTLAVYGKTSAPANGTDGTLLGSVTITDANAMQAVPIALSGASFQYIWVSQTASVTSNTYVFIAQVQYYTSVAPANMTLVNAPLNPAPAASPAKVIGQVWWKDLSGAAVLNTDLQYYATANGGTAWVQGTLTDTGIVTAAGYHLLTATVPLTSGGTSIQHKVLTLNAKSQQVKGWALMTP